ncbi:hypothetical protein GCM10022224_022480 [Nonomuraea antimicrobica]|uniref:Uncharacterized protein n=1 Tax=Nonomuraea antimicrobica TaxID=561173 RepID=A0ABP7BGI7_9ACTN
MNELEERLRAAFDARAQSFETSPDAWARMRERRPGRRRAIRALVAALPVVLLAVFVPVLLSGGPGGNTAVDADTLYQALMRDRTPEGETVTVDNPTEGKSLRLWFAKAKLGYPELCFVAERADAPPEGGCVSVDEEQDKPTRFVGSTLRDGAETALDWGIATQDVGGVTGVTADGQRFPGTVLRPSGASYRVWTVTYPARHDMSAIELTDDQGRALGRASRDVLKEQQRGVAVGASVELPAGVTARPHRTDQGTEVVWTRHGAVLTMTPSKLQEQAVAAYVEENTVSGLAREDVARVEFTFADGTKVDAATRPDPWGLGVTLFSAMNPASDPGRGHRVVAYDSSGAEVWSHDGTGRSLMDDVPAVGEVMTLPGELRVWFGGTSQGMTTLCQSGGVSPYGTSSCAGSTEGEMFPLKAVKYLPEPGSTTYLGVVGKAWESVTAVLSDGRRLDAAFLRGKDTPAPIWHVTIPAGDVALAALTVKTKDGRIDRHPQTDPSCARKAAGTEADRQALPAGVTALVVAPSCLAFFENGAPAPGLPGPLPGEKLSDLLTSDRPVYWTYGDTAWYGYASADTAKVELHSSNGLTATAEAVPDRFGQDVALFALPLPEGARFASGTTAIGYDAEGKKLWSTPEKGIS